MLVAEMHRSFLLKVKSLDRTEIRDTQSYDVLFYLNQAQDIMIDKLLAEQKTDLLRPLMDDATVLAAAFIATGTYDPGIAGAKVVDLSALTNFRNYFRSQSKITRTAVPACTDQYVINTEIDKFNIFQFETNGSNKPIFTSPKCWQEGKYLVVLPDYYTSLSQVNVIYVKTPTVLILTTPASDTCDLPAQLHQQIVDLAVELSMETINIRDKK